MRIALFQSRTGIDPAESASKLEAVIGQAAADGAQILFTPEMSGVLDRNRARAATSIVPEEDDPVLAAVRAAAQARRIWVQLGSLALLRADGRLANRAFLIDPTGRVAARYDKMHMFDVDLGAESWRESAAYAPGEAPVVAETPAGVLGLSICYDLRFPALYQALSGAGATMLAVPSAFTVPTGKAHWHVLLRARAIENAAFVVAAAQNGTHADGRQTYGHSLVVDPWGVLVLDMGEGEGLGFADLDLAQVAQVRARVPVLAHRRTVPAAAP